MPRLALPAAVLALVPAAPAALVLWVAPSAAPPPGGLVPASVPATPSSLLFSGGVPAPRSAAASVGVARYARHYGLNEATATAWLAGLRPAPLARRGSYDVYSVGADGGDSAHAETLERGEPVLVDASGRPALKADGDPIEPSGRAAAATPPPGSGPHDALARNAVEVAAVVALPSYILWPRRGDGDGGGGVFPEPEPAPLAALGLGALALLRRRRESLRLPGRGD